MKNVLALQQLSSEIGMNDRGRKSSASKFLGCGQSTLSVALCRR